MFSQQKMHAKNLQWLLSQKENWDIFKTTFKDDYKIGCSHSLFQVLEIRHLDQGNLYDIQLTPNNWDFFFLFLLLLELHCSEFIYLRQEERYRGRETEGERERSALKHHPVWWSLCLNLPHGQVWQRRHMIQVSYCVVLTYLN